MQFSTLKVKIMPLFLDKLGLDLSNVRVSAVFYSNFSFGVFKQLHMQH